MASNKKDTGEVIHVKLLKSDYKYLMELAKKDSRTLNGLVRLLISNYITDRKNRF